MNFKVTGINFMTVCRTKGGGLLLARVTTILPRYFPGTVHSMPLSVCISHTAVKLEKSRGCEASTGWVWGLF